MNHQIRFAFNTHGLGDCVHVATAMRLYVRGGFDVALQVETNKRWVWQAAGIPIYDGPDKLPLHPYYYPPHFEDLSKPDCKESKIAEFFNIRELPSLGTQSEIWDRVCSEQVNGADSLSLESLADAAILVRDLPKPIILLHTKGTNWQERKSIPDGEAFQLIRELLDCTGGSVITLDWDGRSPTLDHPRCRPSGRIATESFGALCELSDLLIGIDSGPFHLARWFDIKTLYVQREIPAVRCCIPSHRATYLVPSRDAQHWAIRRPLWTLAEYRGKTATVQDITVAAHHLLEIEPEMIQTPLFIDPDNVPGRYMYTRVGHDSRPLELLDNHRIGEGAAGCEALWAVDQLPIGPVLTISNKDGYPTCHLLLQSDGSYRGAWLRHERMKIVLAPIEAESPLVTIQTSPADSPSVEYRPREYGYTSLAEFNRQCIAFARSLPPVKAIAGVPRSGLLAASLVAAELNVPMIPLDSLLDGQLPIVPSLRRTKRGPSSGIFLVIDDTCASGRMINLLRPRLHPDVKTGVIQGSEHADYFGVRFDLELHQSFEWTLLHDDNAEFTLCDLDGVLCEDWVGDEEAEPVRYAEHLRNAKPLRIPSYPLLAVVTNRLAKHRIETELWLKQHGVEYQHLVLSPWRTVAERNAGQNRKAELYSAMSDARLFIESSGREAREIKRLTSRPVFSVEDNALI